MLVRNLRESREELDLKQKDIATILNVHFSTVSGWETGKDTIPIKQLIKYANLYNYSLDYLFGLTYRNIEYCQININKKNVGNNLKALRKNNKYTQKELAKKLNTTQSTISNWENGVNLISTTFICSLLTIYKDFSIDKLFDRERFQFNSKN